MAQQSLGMIETKGFAAIVEAADAMLKAADVTAGQYKKIGAGIVSIETGQGAILIAGQDQVANLRLRLQHQRQRAGALRTVSGARDRDHQSRSSGRQCLAAMRQQCSRRDGLR